MRKLTSDSEILAFMCEKPPKELSNSAAFGIQYPQYSQYHFSISEAKPTTLICSENIEKDFSIPNTALLSNAVSKSIVN
jgi:hypothetical protein